MAQQVVDARDFRNAILQVQNALIVFSNQYPINAQEVRSAVQVLSIAVPLPDKVKRLVPSSHATVMDRRALDNLQRALGRWHNSIRA